MTNNADHYQVSGEKYSILIVDDKPANLRLLLNMLHKNIYTVHPATSGETAWTFLQSTLPDLILLDVIMPIVDGYQLCVRLKENERTKDIPVIFISAGNQVIDKAKAFACGGVDYITKPFQPEEVIMRIQTHLSLRNLQKKLEQRVQERTAELLQLSNKLELHVQERTRELNAALEKLSEANLRLQSLSVIDGLTEIRNRRFFNEYFEREWDRARREQTPLAILLIDIDHFKTINDTYGHLIGDECLKVVAGIMRDSLNRASDEAVRFGGDEFAIVLPNTPLHGAANVAEEIRRRVESHEISLSGISVSLTLSIGVCCSVPQPDLPSSALIAAVDRNLYRAKKNGRNRVESSEILGEDVEETQH